MNKEFCCPVCSTPHDPRNIDLRLDSPVGPLVIYRCFCGLGYSNFTMEGLLAEDVYNPSFYKHIRFNDQAGRQQGIKYLVNHFEKALQMARLPLKQKRLLDVGCATGDFLEYAVKVGWEAEGIDISQFAVRKARERGLRAFVCSIDELSERKDLYNVITLWNVIEHLPDIAKAIQVCSDKLLPAGVIILKTVSRTSVVDFLARIIHSFTLHHITAPLRRMYVPGHLYYFTPSLLRKFVSAFGEVIFFERTDPPPEVLLTLGFMRISLRTLFLLQKATGLTYELSVALMPPRKEMRLG